MSCERQPLIRHLLMRMQVEVAHYLPEFFHVVLKRATETISTMKQDLQRSFPIINFNHCSLTSNLPSFKPMVSRPMRGESTIDLFYTNVKEGLCSSNTRGLWKNLSLATGPVKAKGCVEQLCSFNLSMFSLSLSSLKIPAMWKTSCQAPIPKKANDSCDLANLRSTGLSFPLIKCWERVVLDHLTRKVSAFQDLLQFA